MAKERTEGIYFSKFTRGATYVPSNAFIFHAERGA